MILYVTDLHFHRPWFDWVRAEALRLSCAVAISGDLLNDNIHKAPPCADQVKWVAAWIANFPRPLFLCSGNHDLLDPLETPPKWLIDCRRDGVVVDKGRRVVDGATVVSCPQDGTTFAPSDRWAHGGDILLHHEPPAGHGVAQTKEGTDYGSLDLADYLENTPEIRRIVLSGHVNSPRKTHVRIGNTLCLNICTHSVTRKVPPFGLVDWCAGTVAISTADGNTCVKFPAPRRATLDS